MSCLRLMLVDLITIPLIHYFQLCCTKPAHDTYSFLPWTTNTVKAIEFKLQLYTGIKSAVILILKGVVEQNFRGVKSGINP
jgi:hypothetical protein